MTIQDTLKGAMALVNEGRTEEAKATVRPLVRDAKARPFALMVLAGAVEREGDAAAAVHLYRAAVGLAPGKKDWRARLDRCEDVLKELSECEGKVPEDLGDGGHPTCGACGLARREDATSKAALAECPWCGEALVATALAPKSEAEPGRDDDLAFDLGDLDDGELSAAAPGGVATDAQQKGDVGAKAKAMLGGAFGKAKAFAQSEQVSHLKANVASAAKQVGKKAKAVMEHEQVVKIGEKAASAAQRAQSKAQAAMGSDAIQNAKRRVEQTTRDAVAGLHESLAERDDGSPAPERWWDGRVPAVALLVLFWPAGLLLLWRTRAFSPKGKAVLACASGGLQAILLAFLFLAVAVLTGSSGGTGARGGRVAPQDMKSVFGSSKCPYTVAELKRKFEELHEAEGNPETAQAESFVAASYHRSKLKSGGETIILFLQFAFTGDYPSPARIYIFVVSLAKGLANSGIEGVILHITERGRPYATERGTAYPTKPTRAYVETPLLVEMSKMMKDLNGFLAVSVMLDALRTEEAWRMSFPVEGRPLATVEP